MAASGPEVLCASRASGTSLGAHAYHQTVTDVPGQNCDLCLRTIPGSGLTRCCTRPPTASARTSLPLPAAGELWRYTERERAALVWTEALTMIAEHHVPDAVYNEARQYFSEQELVNLSLAVVAINGWNRLAISFRLEVGAYRAGTVAAMMKKV
jgi:hypothetical protein